MARDDRRRVTSGGRVTIPKRLRDRLGVRPGDVLEFDERGAGVLIARRLPAPLDVAYGSLPLDRSTDEVIDELRGRASARVDVGSQ